MTGDTVLVREPYGWLITSVFRRQRHPSNAPYERPADNRQAAQRDRDRLLYSSAFRRLSGVSQVASASEGVVFHNRMTHTLEVAQIGRRLAEMYLADDAAAGVIRKLGGLDPDVVEAAALAHDLGHPPFGHVGEETLNKRVSMNMRGREGFEGNAQTFRIITKLAVRLEQPQAYGLNLTRATLNATLKYPWLYGGHPEGMAHKWGAYASEGGLFAFAREGWSHNGQCLEAAIMDWADDIAYAVHDLEDFYRAGLIPLEHLSRDDSRGEEERERFVEGIYARWARLPATFKYDRQEIFAYCRKWFTTFPFQTPYDGSPGARGRLRAFSSYLISQYVQKGAQIQVEAQAPLLHDPALKRQVAILKELTWQYVIEGPGLATQQAGQRRIVEDLYSVYHDAIGSRHWQLLPTGDQAFVRRFFSEHDDSDISAGRLAADFIAALTDQQAVRLHRRVTGVDMGSVLDLGAFV